MNNRDFKDMLAREFPKPPKDFHTATVRAMKRAEKCRRRFKAFGAVLVCAVMLFTFWEAKRFSARTDAVASPDATAQPAYVWCSHADPCFHRKSDCPFSAAYTVQMPLETAKEFQKEPCAQCFVDSREN